MARLLSTWFDGCVGSARSTGNKVINAFGKLVYEMQEYFASDFMGYGWKIFNSGSEEVPEYTLEIDNIKIRKALTAHELIIDQVRAVCGSLGISQACGKVKGVSLKTDAHGNDYYMIYLEGEKTHGYGGFMKNDLIRCQRVEIGDDGTTKGIKGYWVKAESVGDGFINVMASEFVGSIKQSENGDFVYIDNNPMNIPAAGDEIVQYGNTTDKTRQSAIYIHATESGVPTIDLLNGINNKSFSGKIIASIGRIPDGGGFGLYMKNGRIESKDTATNKYNYLLNEDGSFDLGRGAITFKDGVVTIGGDVVIKWGAGSKSNVTYQVGSSGTEAPAGTWATNIPATQVGKYLWTRTKWPDGTYSYSVSYMAKDGTNGKDGKDGTDGESMRPNLLDYTEFAQSTFDDVPKPDKAFVFNGDRAEGIDGNGALKIQTFFKINGNATTPDIEFDFFQQNIKSKISPSTWYTLSFYLKCIYNAQPLQVFFYTWTSGSKMVDTSVKMIVDGAEKDTAENGSVKIAPTTQWVKHTITFKTASELPDTCLCLFRTIQKQILTTVKLEPYLFVGSPKLEASKSASAWCRSDGDIANIAADKVDMPSWVRQWDGQTTELGADYVAAQNAAFGTKDSDGKFSGIAMSGGGFDIGGQNVIGLYAMSKDKCAVKINPTTGEYIFVGNVLCDGGQMNGLLNGSYIKGITQITTEAEWDDVLSVYKETYYKPDFYKLNPIIILSYAKIDAPMIYLPPYDKTAEKLLEAYQFIGYTFWIVNKSGKIISIEPSSSIKMEKSTIVPNASGESVLTKSYSIANLQQRKIANGKSASLTGVLDSDGNFFWVIEQIGVNEAITGSSGTITPSFGLGGNTLKWNTGLTGGSSGLLNP